MSTGPWSYVAPFSIIVNSNCPLSVYPQEMVKNGSMIVCLEGEVQDLGRILKITFGDRDIAIPRDEVKYIRQGAIGNGKTIWMSGR